MKLIERARRLLVDEPAWRVALALALFVALCGVCFPRYLGARLAPDLCADAAVSGVAAIGAAFVLSCGSIDLSTGSLAACASLVVARCANAGIAPPWALLAGAVAGLAAGTWLGWLVRWTRVPAFVGTLAGLFALRALALGFAEESLAVQDPSFAAWSSWSLAVAGAPWRAGAWLLLAALVAGSAAAHWWSSAREALVAGADEAAARQAGIDVEGVRVRMHAAAGLMGGLAGGIYALNSGSGTAIGLVGLELDAIASAVVGGTLLAGGRASVPGAVLGALFFAALSRALLFAGVADAGWARLVAALLLFGFLLAERLLARGRARRIAA